MTEGKTAQPGDGSNSSWTRPYRRYLALRQDDDFAAALTIAPVDVAEFVTLSLRGDAGAANERIAPLRERLADSREELLTIQLSYHDIYARLCETFKDFPFHQQNDALNKGVQACELAIQIARELEELPCAAFFAYIMAKGLRGRGFPQAACDALRAAWALYRELAQTSPDVYRPEVATTLNELGIVLTDLRALEDARAAYTEALLIRRELAQSRPEVYLPDVAMTLNNLGTVLSDLPALEDARAVYIEAVLIYRELAQNRPDIYRREVAMILSNLGLVLRDLRALQDARAAYTEALIAWRELALSSPDMYRPDLATTLNTLGKVLTDLRALEDARATYIEALLIRRELAQSNPDAYRPGLAGTLNDLGLVLRDLRSFEDARAAYTEALLIRRELAQSKPDIYRPALAATLNNLGLVLRDLRALQDARGAYAEALPIYRELAQSNPDVYRPDVAATLNNLGIVLSDLRAKEDMRAAYAEALPIYRELAQSNPDVYRPYLAGVLNNVGLVLRELRALQDARAAYAEALPIYRELAQSNPDVYRPNVAATLNNLGIVLDELRCLEDARAAYTEALLVWRELAESRPDVYRPEVAKTLNNLGNLLRVMSALDDARDCFRSSLDLLLGTERGKELWIDASGPCASLCRLARDQGRLDEARRLAEQAIEYLESGLAQLSCPEHNDKFKSPIEDATLILVEQYSSEPPSAETSGKLVRLFEWLRRVQSRAQLNQEGPALTRLPTSFPHPILWTQRVQDRLIFGVLLPGEQLRVLQSEKIESQLWRRQVETALNALAEGDPEKVAHTAGRLFASFPEEVRNLLLENSRDPIFVSPCSETLELPLELIPAPDGDNGLPFAGLRRLAVRFHGLAELDALLKRTACRDSAPTVLVGDPTAGTARALKYAQAGAEYLAGLLKAKALVGSMARRASVLPAISDPSLGTFVFSGHGAPGELLMSEGEFIGFRDFGAIKWDNAPFIHLDCCYAGTVVGGGGGRFLGMPSVMLGCGAGAVLASFHPLYDKQAMLFSNSLYGAMIAGQPLGDALMVVRRTMHAECGGTPIYWATSVLWGTPQIRLKEQ